MCFVAMPPLVEVALVGRHQPEPNLAKTQRPPHQRLYRRVDLRMANQFVEFGRRDQRLVIGLLVVAVAMPEIGVFIPIAVEHRAKILAAHASEIRQKNTIFFYVILF